MGYTPFIPYTSTKPFNCLLKHISKFNGKYLYLNIKKYTYSEYSALKKLKVCLDNLYLVKKLFQLTFNKPNSLIKMEKVEKLNKPEIKIYYINAVKIIVNFYQKLIHF